MLVLLLSANRLHSQVDANTAPPDFGMKTEEVYKAIAEGDVQGVTSRIYGATGGYCFGFIYTRFRNGPTKIWMLPKWKIDYLDEKKVKYCVLAHMVPYDKRIVDVPTVFPKSWGVGNIDYDLWIQDGNSMKLFADYDPTIRFQDQKNGISTCKVKAVAEERNGLVLKSMRHSDDLVVDYILSRFTN